MKQIAEKQPRDFNDWMALAQCDPEQFELMRLQAIDELIESMPEDRKMHLRRIQWRIDRVRERSASPMAATIAISRMMWDAFYSLRDQYQYMFADKTGGVRPHREPQLAEVIRFPQLAEA